MWHATLASHDHKLQELMEFCYYLILDDQKKIKNTLLEFLIIV